MYLSMPDRESVRKHGLCLSENCNLLVEKDPYGREHNERPEGVP